MYVNCKLQTNIVCKNVGDRIGQCHKYEGHKMLLVRMPNIMYKLLRPFFLNYNTFLYRH